MKIRIKQNFGIQILTKMFQKIIANESDSTITFELPSGKEIQIKEP